MGTPETKRTTIGWAARDPSGVLSPYKFTLTDTGPEDVYIKVLYCGICHSDLHQIKNDLGMSNYAMVLGHDQGYPEKVTPTTGEANTKGHGSWRGCSAGLCCYCCLGICF